MTRHNRSRGPATRAQPAPPPRPPREAAPALTVLRPNAAGIDVHSDMHMVCVPAASVPPATGDGGLPANVRRFGANSCDLHAIAEWLRACGVTTVAMESTGVYWVPLFELLEARGFEVWLVEPGQLSRCGARPKTDALDAQWIQRLHSYGLLQPSFRPADSVLALRGYHRQRQMLVRYAAGHTLHMQKALEQMNVKLAEVVSDITGQSHWATARSNLVQDGKGLYGRASAVSAANPMTAGVIALMLQINPKLTAAEAKKILQQAARSDKFTCKTPNPNWGYGKLDVYAALKLTKK